MHQLLLSSSYGHSTDSSSYENEEARNSSKHEHLE